ncbi:unnamed protein product, partial [Ectocarpus sp. 6 AP-2014]
MFRNPSIAPCAPNRRISWVRPAPLLVSGRPTPYRPDPPAASLPSLRLQHHLQ